VAHGSDRGAIAGVSQGKCDAIAATERICAGIMGFPNPAPSSSPLDRGNCYMVSARKPIAVIPTHCVLTARVSRFQSPTIFSRRILTGKSIAR
jgi:hypothetical protein